AIIDFPLPTSNEVLQDDTVKRIGDLRISVPLYNIYMAETDELVRLLGQDLAEWRHEAERPVSQVAVAAAHSLAGSSATVGFDAMQELAHAVEMVLQTLMRNPVQLQEQEFDLLDESVVRIKHMLQQFALCEMPEEQPQQISLLKALQQEVFARADRAGPQMAVPSEEPEVYEAPSFTVTHPAPEIASSISETPSQPEGGDPEVSLFEHRAVDDSGTEPLPRDELDSDLLPVFLEEGNDMLPQMQQALREWQTEPAHTQPAQAMLRYLHTLKGSARMAGAMALGQHLHEMESQIQRLMGAGSPSYADIDELLTHMDAGLQMFEYIQHPPAAGTVSADVVVPDESASAETSSASEESASFMESSLP